MNKKKILITTGIYPPEIGGPATYTVLLEKEMPKHDIEVSVLPFRTVRHLPPAIRHLVFLLKVLKQGMRADLLYTQDTVSVGFPTMLAAKILRKPFLIRVPGDWVWEQSAQRFNVKETIDDFQKKKYGFKVEFLRMLQSVTVRYADKAITPSNYFTKLVARWNPQKDNAITIYNGIDFSDIEENKNNFKLRTFISSGRLVPWKGFDVLIEMLKDLPEWNLTIAGDGPDRRRLEKIISEYNLEARVSLLGNIDRVAMIKKIQESEIFILNTSFESFSFVIVEAMFAGTPVISTNIGNISEIIENGEEGLLVEPNSKKEILLAIQKLHDQDFRSKIIKNAKEKSKNFSLEKTILKTAEVVLSLIKNKN